VVCSGCATALTDRATSISKTAAVVAGWVVSNTGGEVEYWVEFGPTQAYGSESAHQTVTAAQNTVVRVSATVSGLDASTLYHFRFCARDAQQQGGPGCGADQTFTTQSVDCGDTVTTDVRLTGELLCFSIPALIVGADGVEIDLGGYGIFGGITSGGGGPIGIDNTAGHNGVTVRNGDIGGFGFGIVTEGASHNRILDVAIGVAGNAVTIEGGQANEVRRSDLFGRSYGLQVIDSDGLVVAAVFAEGVFGDGISASGDFARIVRSTVSRRGGEFPEASGIRLVGNEGRIAENGVGGAWSRGGIVVAGTGNVLVDNVVHGATIPDGFPEADVAGDGIFVSAFSSGVVLRRNRAEQNEGDGIEVQAPGTRLEDNAAFNNGDWGIDAVSGVIDLGGNSAGGNGQPSQCRNVICL
jgi:hypothetical protein